VNQQRDWQSVLYQNFYSEKQIRLIVQDNLLDRTEISFDNWKRISQLCKEIVELRMKLETEVVASIEVPFRQFLQI